MPKLLKKLILSFLAFLVIFSSLAPTFPAVKAQGDTNTWFNQDFKSWYTKVYDESVSSPSEIFGERYTAAQVEWVIYSLFAFVINKTTGDPKTTSCLMNNDLADCMDRVRRFFEDTSKAVTQGYQPNTNLANLIFAERRFSGIGYLKEKARHLKLVPEAKAQTTGFGFTALDPIINLWSAVRDFAFALAVVVILILAFMIMFRVKISPQVVITVQSAIPKVIIALIFVTFSYAIAGFLIDIMYVVIGALSLFFGQMIGNATKVYGLMTHGFITGGFLSMIAMYSVLFFWTLLGTLFLSGVPPINVILTPIIIFIFLILIILAAVVLLFLVFKIFWLLLKTLAQIYLTVIFGPLQIMLGAAFPAIPSLGVGAWIKSLASNLAVYPTVGALFILSLIFLFQAILLALSNLLGGQIISTLIQAIFGGTLDLPRNTWSPPLTLGESYLPLLFLGVSFVILTIIPKTAELIQSVIKGQPFSYGSEIGKTMAVGAAYGLYGVGSLSGADWPFPLNLLLRRRGPDGRWYTPAVPEWLQRQAEAAKRPIETVTGIARGGK